MIMTWCGKNSAFRNLVRGEPGRYMLVLAFAPLTALAAWKANGAVFSLDTDS
jgi:hypothetical protein